MEHPYIKNTPLPPRSPLDINNEYGGNVTKMDDLQKPSA